MKKYIDKNGKARRVGIPDRLKESQLLGNLLISITFPKKHGAPKLLQIDYLFRSIGPTWDRLLRAYTAKFADLLATHARQPLKVAWFKICMCHCFKFKKLVICSIFQFF